MSLFGKKNDLENCIDKFKQTFIAENEIAEMSADIWKQWSKLESDYARELLMIKTQLDKMPHKFEYF